MVFGAQNAFQCLSRLIYRKNDIFNFTTHMQLIASFRRIDEEYHISENASAAAAAAAQKARRCVFTIRSPALCLCGNSPLIVFCFTP
jgi:hypothetical protein